MLLTILFSSPWLRFLALIVAHRGAKVEGYFPVCLCVCVSVYVCALQLSNIYLHTNFTLKSLRSLFYGRGKNQLTKD